jgi:plastocyanin
MRRTAMTTLSMVIGVLGVAVAQARPAGWGRVTGRVTILERDNKPTKDLADAVVWIDAQQAWPRDSNPARTLDIAINDKIYAPRVIVAPVHSTVRFPNHDPFNHNVFSVSGGNSFDLGLFGRGEARSQTFAHEGLVRVFCNIHPRMVAYVVLVNNPFFTQPAADGSFALSDLPPGRYKLHVWHERVPSEVVQDVVVGQGAAPVQIQLDARKYRFQQHKNKLGKNYPTNAGRERY